MNAVTAPTPARSSHWRRYWTLYLLIAVCVAPVVASYFAYYVFPPSGRTNYGQLIEPQRPVPALSLRALDGSVIDASALRGKWTMLQVVAGPCDEACAKRVWLMRQLRLMQGKDADRIERVVMLMDGGSAPAELVKAYEGTLFLQADRAQLQAFLPSEGASKSATSISIDRQLWLIDPLGNLMMVWPDEPDASRVKKDLSRLLKASRIG